MIKDYYKTLCVSKEATPFEIKKSYRDLAIELHPDKNKAATAHQDFVELNEAFQILSDELKRKKYDILYDHYFNASPINLSNSAKEGFESIRKEARMESEKIADSNYYIFMTELLTELIGQTLFSGLLDGVGSILKGTGEIIGDSISGIDFDF